MYSLSESKSSQNFKKEKINNFNGTFSYQLRIANNDRPVTLTNNLRIRITIPTQPVQVHIPQRRDAGDAVRSAWQHEQHAEDAGHLCTDQVVVVVGGDGEPEVRLVSLSHFAQAGGV